MGEASSSPVFHGVTSWTAGLWVSDHGSGGWDEEKGI